MLYKIIFTYLLAIIVAVNFHLDISIIVFVSIILFILQRLIFYKGHIKDIGPSLKDIFPKGHEFLSFILLLFVFYMSFINTQHEIQKVSYRDLDQKTFYIDGKIVSSKKDTGGGTVTIEVEKLQEVGSNTAESDFPRYLDIKVTQFSESGLYDKVSLLGILNFSNYKKYYDNSPIFFTYEYTKLLYNTPWQVSYPKSYQEKVSEKSILEDLFNRFHLFGETLKQNLETYMDQQYAAIAEGIVLGEQENLIKGIKDIFKTSGLIHILVLSGANVSFIIFLATYILGRVNLNKKVRVFLGLTFSWVFIFLTGLTAPAVRAGVMSSSNILTEIFGKNISSLQSLVVALFVLTLVSPLSLIYSPSLHLSFLACFALFVATPKIEKILKNSSGFFSKNNIANFLLSTTIGIFIFTTPYVLALSGSANLFGTVLTFVAEPFVLLITITTFLLILISFINFYLTSILAFINTIFAKITLGLAELGTNFLPVIHFEISKTQLLIYYLVLFVIILKDDESK